MSRALTPVLALTVTLALPHALAANGSPMAAAPSSTPSASMTPEAMAREAFNSGIGHNEKGKKAEAEAALKQGKDHDKALEKARDEFTKALKDFKKATDLDPSLFAAYSGMGFALRKTGDYAKALENYDRALSMSPNFADAIEYRGEAYLGLNRIDDAKQAYLKLFGLDRKQADQLLAAMTAWVAKQQAQPTGTDAAAVTALDTWIKERAKIATTTAAMAVSSNSSVWK